VLRGQFSTMAIADVLEWIGRRQISGRMVVDDGRGVTRIFRLEAGAVVWATSTEPTETIGQMLRGAGHVDDQLLAAALADEAPGPLGTRLVEAGAIAASTLRAALQVKMREALWDLQTWTDGRFDVETGGLAPSPGVRVVVSVGDALALAARRAPRWPAIRAAIPSDDVGFAPGPGHASTAGYLPFDDGRLQAAAITGLPVRALVAAMGGHRFAVLDRLATLVETGALVVGPATAVEPDVDALVALAGQRAAAGAWAGALAVASEAVAAAPGDAVVHTLYRRIERARVASLARALLAPPRVPELRRAPDELGAGDLTELERTLLQAVDGRWDLLTLVEQAPVRAAEALLVFARLAERGIVELT
jgi:hypothetical protein